MAGSRRRRRRKRSMGKRVPVRTYNDWNGPPPGFLEIDLVVHSGGPLSGSFIHSLVATYVCIGWTEAVPQEWRGIMAKELVYAGTAEPFAQPNGLPEVALVGADPRC